MNTKILRLFHLRLHEIKLWLQHSIYFCRFYVFINGHQIIISRLLSGNIRSEKKQYVIEEPENVIITIPKYWKGSEEKKVSLPSKKITIKEFVNAIAVGGDNGIICKEGYFNCSVVGNHLNWNNIDIRNKVILYQKKDLVYLETQKPSTSIDCAISLLGPYSCNYYHFLIETITQLQYLDTIEEYRKLPILVDKGALDIPQIQQIINVYNRAKHKVIGVALYERITCHRLILCDKPTMLPGNVVSYHCMDISCYSIRKDVIHYIRNSVKLSSRDPEKKIFISRRNLVQLRIINEREIEDIFIRHGYEIVYPEDLNFIEQVSLFSSATYIAGSSGAALSNVIFSREGATLICIIPATYKFYLYSTLASMNKLNNIFIDANIRVHTPWSSQDEYWVNPDEIESMLSEEDNNR